MPQRRSEAVVVDVSALVHPDAEALDVLARLQLVAHRLGTAIVLRGASRELVDLLAFAGLDDLLPVVRSGLDSGRQVEEPEQSLVDEEVDAGDPTV